MTTYEDVRVRLAFPLSQSDRSISFQLDDGTELGTLDDIQSLDQVSAQALKSVLEMTYFIPRITRVHEIREEFGVTRWHVTTDRGRRTFEAQSRHDVRPVGPGRYIIRGHRRKPLRDPRPQCPRRRKPLLARFRVVGVWNLGQRGDVVNELVVTQRAYSPGDWHVGYLDETPAIGSDDGRWYFVTTDAVIHNPGDRLVWIVKQEFG